MVFNSQLNARLRDDIPGLRGDIPVVTGAGATGFRDVVSRDLIPEILEAYNGALTRTFLVAVGAACVGVGGVVWYPLRRRRTQREGGGECGLID
jgi:hypothetical protein